MKNFKQLLIWQKGMKLVADVYMIAGKLPKTENYGLRSQLTRSAISIPSNIAEGSSRQSQKEYRYFVEIALGSAFELETQLLITKGLALVDSMMISNVIMSLDEEQKMLNSFAKKLAASS